MSMNRKGMPTIAVIVGIVTSLLIGSAILGSLQAIKTESLDPNADQAMNALDQVGGIHATIGEGVNSDTARQQMQGLITWNMLAASDCRVLSTFHHISSGTGADESEISEDSDAEPFDASDVDWDPGGPDGDKALKTRTTQGFLNHMNGNNGGSDGQPNINGYTGKFRDFTPLIESGYDRACIGTSSVIKEVEDAASNAANDGLKGAISGLAKYGSAGLALGGGIACLATAGVGCAVAAGVAAGGLYLSADTVGQAASNVIIPGAEDNVAKEPGFDMEGNQGRAEFNISQTFFMSENDYEQEFDGDVKPFLGMSMALPDSWSGKPPKFWRGKRFSFLLPPGLNPGGEDNKPTARNSYYHIYLAPDGYVNNVGLKQSHFDTAQEAFYAFRPRMVDVPAISDRELDEDTLTSVCARGENSCNPTDRVRSFIDHTEYLFCDGAAGYIRSNAGSIGNTGEASSQDSQTEDQVYPKVEIEEGAFNCTKRMESSTTDVLDCDDQDDILDTDPEKIFERETADGSIYTSGVACGAIGPKTADFGEDYGDAEVEYYEVGEVVTQCSARPYDITTQADMSGDVEESDGSIVFDEGAGSDDSWRHVYYKDYEDDPDGWISYFQDLVDSIINNNDDSEFSKELMYQTMEFNFSHPEERKTFRIDIEGSPYLDEVPYHASSQAPENIERTIIVEAYPLATDNQRTSFDLIYDRGQYEDPTLASQSVDAVDGQNSIKIDRTEGTAEISVNQNTIVEDTRLTWSVPSWINEAPIKVENIEITPVDENGVEEIDENYDLDSYDTAPSVAGNQGSLDFEQNEGELTIDNIITEGNPRMCEYSTE